ncbi:glycosyltransferase family 2 protein [Nostocoides japonicum]|nr:glycosyltransferase family A protein [Tetrasphaera japonica]
MAAQQQWPSLGVVIATHKRPELMRRALESVLTQDYEGVIYVALVFDRCEPDITLTKDANHRSVSVLTNTRTPGLAGARNTGILSLDTELVAFCDDDDQWLPGKIRAQVERLEQVPEADFVTTAMRVNFRGKDTVRLAGTDTVTVQDMARSRMAMLHSSSFMFRRAAMLEGFGLVDEDIPQSMAEDWDLLLRAARAHPITHVDHPLVDIQWGQNSYFNEAWRDKNEAQSWLLEHHPEMRQDRTGAALQYGKLAFGHAALGERKRALRYVWKTLLSNWREPRGPIALAVISGLPAERIQDWLNRYGHGI